MPNIASALKEEISRLARKEVRAATDPLKRASANYRSEIAALKRIVQQLEKEVKRAARATLAKPVVEDAESETAHRWRPAGFAQHRKRLGLSAADAGRLLGVSQLTVYKWEGGQVRPRPDNYAAIAQFRSIGKREAANRLSEI